MAGSLPGFAGAGGTRVLWAYEADSLECHRPSSRGESLRRRSLVIYRFLAEPGMGFVPPDQMALRKEHLSGGVF